MAMDGRMLRREQLYAVVREAMVRVGVLSAGYKFKVLALDQRGAQFLVMMDMAPEYAGDARQGAETEALIMQAAKARHDILVTAVYWRVNEQLAQAPTLRGAAADSRPAPLQHAASASRPAPLRSTPRSAPVPSRPAPLAPTPSAPGRFDPIEADEVAAFKQALADAAAARPAQQPPAASGQVTRSGPLLPPSTGFEDTLMPEQNGRKADLSSTQYGDL